MLVDDFEHIVNLRKNAALVATGRIWNALWHFGAFRLGNSNAGGKAPKPKSD